jgi:hypothetical protein
MTPLAQRVANAVYARSPQVLCFSCLAAEQGLDEHDVRGTACVLVARAGLSLVERPCASCRRLKHMLVAEVAA